MVLWKILARSWNLGSIIDGSQSFKFFLLTGLRVSDFYLSFFLSVLSSGEIFLSWSQILVPKLWFPSCFSNGKLPYPKTSRTTINYWLITTDNTQNSCDRRVLHVHQDLVIIICKGVFFNLSIFPVHTNTLSTCLPTWLLITLSRFSWDSLFLICSGEAVCFCVAVKTRFDN